jgi:restriction system protein
MPEVTRRRTGEFVRKLFEILLQHPDGLQARDALSSLEKKVELSEYEQGFYANGARRFDKIVRFATIDCVKAGWLMKTKGRWTITEAGKEAFSSIKDPETFYREAVKLYWQWKNSQPGPASEASNKEEGEPESKSVSITFEEAEEQSWKEVEQFLKLIPPYEFQELVGSLLRAMGYHVFWIAPPGKDGGIDILAGVDPLGTRPPRIKVQVKRQWQTIAVDGLRSFLAVLGDGDVGLFISLGGFTKDAQEEARTQEKRRVTLIDAERLVDLWIEHYEKLTDDARRKLPLKPIYFLAPE